VLFAALDEEYYSLFGSFGGLENRTVVDGATTHHDLPERSEQHSVTP